MSRQDLFDSLDRPALKPLPEAEWHYAEWRLARMGIDYHVEVEGFYYSVPYALIRAEVDLRITERTIEAFHRGQRVAAHQRRYGGRRHGTEPDHMPSAHRRYAEWSPERLQRWGKAIGPNTEGLIIAVLANRPHPGGLQRPLRTARPGRCATPGLRAPASCAQRQPRLRSWSAP